MWSTSSFRLGLHSHFEFSSVIRLLNSFPFITNSKNEISLKNIVRKKKNFPRNVAHDLERRRRRRRRGRRSAVIVTVPASGERIENAAHSRLGSTDSPVEEGSTKVLP